MRAAGGIGTNEGLRHHREGAVAAISHRCQLRAGAQSQARNSLLARAVRASGTPDAVVEKLNSALQEVISDPAIVKSWAETGVAPYAKDQRSPAAARTLLKSEIARWGQVVRDNNIQAPMQ